MTCRPVDTRPRFFLIVYRMKDILFHIVIHIVERRVQMVGSELNRTRGKRGKKRGETGARARERVPSFWSSLPFSLSSLPSFCFLANFFPALYSVNAWNRLHEGKMPCLELCLRIVKFQNTISDCISAWFDRIGKMKNRFFHFCNK